MNTAVTATATPSTALADVPMHRLSIVVPMYNEVENVEPFVTAVHEALRIMAWPQFTALLGELLRGQRHHWVLATKLGNPMSDRGNEAHYSRSWMLREVEASLGRLQTDHVDILYLHRDYNGMNLEEPLRALDAMLRAGKIRYWGVSNFRGWRITELVHLARQMGMPGPVVCQPYYNLLNRMPEVEILPACAHYGIGVTPYSPIARGVLTGKYLPGQPPAEGSR